MGRATQTVSPRITTSDFHKFFVDKITCVRASTECAKDPLSAHHHVLTWRTERNIVPFPTYLSYIKAAWAPRLLEHVPKDQRPASGRAVYAYCICLTRPRRHIAALALLDLSAPASDKVDQSMLHAGVVFLCRTTSAVSCRTGLDQLLYIGHGRSSAPFTPQHSRRWCVPTTARFSRCCFWCRPTRQTSCRQPNAYTHICSLKPRLRDTAGCHTRCTTGYTGRRL